MRTTLAIVPLAIAAGLCLAACKTSPSVTGAGASGFKIEGATEEALVARYDALADEILKVHPNETEAQKAEEIGIVRALLGVYKGQADAALTGAKAAGGKEQVTPLEKAIDAVTYLAREGDKKVNDVKLRLQKGGHHHSKAEGSDEEWILVKPADRKALMDDAAKLRELLAGANNGQAAPVETLDSIQKRVDELASAAIGAKK
jgi:hypothetical protein